jgi:hypothetical protein
LRKVKNGALAEWDRTHDEAGNVTVESSATEATGNEHLIRRVKVRDTTVLDFETEGKV